ncbi:hypothetical protein CEXT_611201 [Caerostris extrusa]|uniref:Uncharacterized protein n=1 Tax=Caerostris extrusa TaxID=172846 RepID=A0AAV4R7I8_CAEEX|nr:hypothetical protein CEXT_611201 [Caerostris extrusa]
MLTSHCPPETKQQVFQPQRICDSTKKPNRNLPCLKRRCPQETNVPYNTFVALKEDVSMGNVCIKFKNRTADGDSM